MIVDFGGLGDLDVGLWSLVLGLWSLGCGFGELVFGYWKIKRRISIGADCQKMGFHVP